MQPLAVQAFFETGATSKTFEHIRCGCKKKHENFEIQKFEKNSLKCG